MDKLRELVLLATPNKTKNITIIGSSKKGGTKLHQLYELITSGDVTDEEAFAVLYPGSSSKNSYYKLKHELRERLYNTLFFVDAKKVRGNTRQSMYLRCQQLISLSAILVVSKLWNNAISITKSALAIAEKYEFTNEAVSAARRMMLISRIRGTEKEVTDYSIELIRLVLLQQKEMYAETFWTQLSIKFTKSNSYKKEIIHRADNYSFQLKMLKIESETLRLIYLETMIEASMHMAGHHFDQAVPILASGLQKVSSYPKFQDESYTYGISVNLLACYISLKNHTEAREILSSLYENIIPGAYNWYKTCELHFTLHMHTRHYAEAESIHANTVQQKTFKKQPAFIQEAWAVYGAYLHILRLAGQLPEEEKSPKRFRVSRYLNDLPTFTKDKRGHNITVLISQIILMLQRRNYDGLIDRFEAINKYRERYVSREVNFRSNVFLHMLREVHLNDFKQEQVIAKTAELRVRLDEEPIDVINPGYDQEILPYEELWDLLVHYLH